MKLAIFDIDGTLTRGAGIGTKCFFSAFGRVFGDGAVDTEFHSYRESTDGGIAREAAVRALGRDPAPDELNRFKTAYFEELELAISGETNAYRPVGGACEVLTLLEKSPDWVVAIATGNWRRAAILKLTCAGICIPEVAACSEDGYTRSEVLGSAVRFASEQSSQRRFERVVYVGDQLWDLRAACEVGVGFVGVGSGESAQNLKSLGAPVVSCYEDTVRFLTLLEDVASSSGVGLRKK